MFCIPNCFCCCSQRETSLSPITTFIVFICKLVILVLLLIAAIKTTSLNSTGSPAQEIADILLQKVVLKEANATIETILSTSNDTIAEMAINLYRLAVQADKSILNLILAAGFIQIVPVAAIFIELYDYNQQCASESEVQKGTAKPVPFVRTSLFRLIFRLFIQLTIIACIIFAGAYYQPASATYSKSEEFAKTLFTDVANFVNKTQNAIQNHEPTYAPAAAYPLGINKFSLPTSTLGLVWSATAFTILSFCV